MPRRLVSVALNFLAGLAGNLIAGWIQQDIWGDLFTLPRIFGTLIGVMMMLVALAWLESRIPTKPSPESLLKNLRRKAQRNFDTSLNSIAGTDDPSERKAMLLDFTNPKEVVEIDRIVSRSFNDQDYSTFKYGTSMLADLILHSTKWVRKLPPNEQKIVMSGVVGAHFTGIVHEYSKSPRAWQAIAEVLSNHDNTARARGDWIAAEAIGELWREFGYATVRQGLENEIIWILNNMASFSLVQATSFWEKFGDDLWPTLLQIEELIATNMRLGNKKRALTHRLETLQELRSELSNAGTKFSEACKIADQWIKALREVASTE